MGRCWVFGDNVSTDHIIPGRYNITTDSRELAKHVFEYARPEFTKKVRIGDVVVAGENFGCGSSREHAVIGLKECGVQIVAKTYGWIFKRNCINNGLLPLQLEKFVDTAEIQDQDEVVLNQATNTLDDLRRNRSFPLRPAPRFLQEIVRAGTLIEYINVHRGYRMRG